jgi:hypothetical protein
VDGGGPFGGVRCRLGGHPRLWAAVFVVWAVVMAGWSCVVVGVVRCAVVVFDGIRVGLWCGGWLKNSCHTL